jgi:hypothetical protein
MLSIEKSRILFKNNSKKFLFSQDNNINKSNSVSREILLIIILLVQFKSTIL